MIIKIFMYISAIFLTCISNVKSDYERYQKLKINNVPSIKKEDLPAEFSDYAFKTIDEFIKKTSNIDFECAIYFDYVTGEIIKCAIGKANNVILNFDNEEFNDFNVASIHNHPNNVFSPPSGKNFGILERKFEDYELIAGRDWFWIFKAKGINEDLVVEFNIASSLFFNSAYEYCSNIYDNSMMIDYMTDVLYGIQLSKYINDKHINYIQLIRKEYDNLTIKPKETIEFSSFKRISDPEVMRIARERERDPNIISGKDMVYAFYQLMGMEIDYDDIFKLE